MLLARTAGVLTREIKWLWRYQLNPRIQTSLKLNPARVAGQLKAAEIFFEDFTIDVEQFQQFLANCTYPETYHIRDRHVRTEKCLEHYISLRILNINRDDAYLDIASAASPFPQYVKRTIGCTVYRNDLEYERGSLMRDGIIWIGSNATALPLPSGCISKATLHCSLEHLEGDSDSALVQELERVLRPGGAACILPLYLHSEYIYFTDPFADRSGLVLDPEMRPIYRRAYGQRQGRYYTVPQLQKRILGGLRSLTFSIYRVANLDEVAGGLWCHWVLLLSKRT